MRVSGPAILLLAAALPAHPQVTITVPEAYVPGRPPEQQVGTDYGPARVADLEQVIFAPENYQRAHVIVMGQLQPAATPEYMNLTSGTATLLLIPGHGLSVHDLRGLVGARVEVRGVVRFIRKKEFVPSPAGPVDLDLLEDPGLPALPEQSPMLPRVSITALSLTDRDSRDTHKAKTTGAMVYEILEDPAQYAGKTVKVRGQFRGRNLFGDLPAGTERTRDDWVLKDGERALWVTGKAPRGKGFSLDPAYKGDAVRWLEVAGKPEVANGIVYLRASKVILGSPPPPVEGEEAASN